MNFFLDTNAIVKLYHKEKGTDKLIKFLKENRNELVLVITDISKVEFYSVFYRKVRSKEIELKRIHEVFDLFKKDLSSFYIIEVDSTIKDFSIDLLYKHGAKDSLRTLDAIQLSSALFSNQLLKIDYFISSDKNLLGVANKYFKVLNPEN